MEKREQRRQWIFLVILFIIIVFGHCITARAAEDTTMSFRELMVDSMRTELDSAGIEHADIVLRQSIWESGWFECYWCSWRYNNPFGFRHKSWVTEDNPQGYLKFDTWQESVAYYKRWQDKYYDGGDYYQFLIDIGYAADGEKYVDHLKSLNV